MESVLKSEDRILPAHTLLFLSIYNFLIFSLFLFNRAWGIGLTLFEIAHVTPMLLMTKTKSKLFYIKILFAILASIFYWIRADDIIRTLSLITVIGLNIVIFQEATTGQIVSPSYLLRQLFIWIEKLVNYSVALVNSRFVLLHETKKIQTARHPDLLKKVFTGVLISSPILLILILLFASADSNFENLFTALFDKIKFIFDFEWVKKLSWLWNLFYEFVFFWLYLCLVFPYKESHAVLKSENFKSIVEKLTVGVLIAGIFAVFIITQFKTVSFILEGFSTGNLNPSLFVREGFFQLIISCLIGLGVFHFIKNELAKNFITSLLLIEVFLVALTAGEKVWLYQYKFGLTQARVWGIFFLFFLFSIITALYLHLKNKISNNIKWQIFLLSFSSLVIIAGFMNIDKLIAIYRPPVVNEKVDVLYMARVLSWDAADLWVEGLESDDLTYKYKLASNIDLFIANNENDDHRQYTYIKVFDITKVCNNSYENWLSENTAISSNKEKICKVYSEWQEFKIQNQAQFGSDSLPI